MKGMMTGLTLILSSWCAMLAMAPRTPADLPKVTILATGGSIVDGQAQVVEAGYQAASFDVQALIEAVPQLRELADLTGERLATAGDPSVNDADWLKLGRRLGQVVSDPAVSGVVITLGTDTLEETAYFLSLVTKSDKAVVMTGSTRPATAVGADGPTNLYNAVALSTNAAARGRGVLVTLNDEVHFARELEKSNSTQRDTFHSPNRGRAGIINTGRAKLWSHLETCYGAKSEFSLERLRTLPRVEIVYSHANATRAVIDALVADGVQGIVLAGEGNSDDVLAGVRDAARKGVAIVRSTRGSGGGAPHVELSDDRLGLVASQELNPAKARVLLMLALTRTRDPKLLQSYFDRY
jgi:L-asparaginase